MKRVTINTRETGMYDVRRIETDLVICEIQKFVLPLHPRDDKRLQRGLGIVVDGFDKLATT